MLTRWVKKKKTWVERPVPGRWLILIPRDREILRLKKYWVRKKEREEEKSRMLMVVVVVVCFASPLGHRVIERSYYMRYTCIRNCNFMSMDVFILSQVTLNNYHHHHHHFTFILYSYNMPSFIFYSSCI